ncbi:YlbF family regulator [Capillibacterium thermochitinicola]|uniref:YlbF family regulator n=1 Tax=Capillibacterium thermochitinicola TaxID=2699427 RepID=A0A8J6I3F6_9FIRM|nr:YlbF family regulator [Capillibacterium thermochitinicola]MBA2133769.1 YlbF family regulator [Capillibacterium thermochitinicola]
MKPQDLAKELANSIRESPEYQAWEKAKAEVDKHEAAKIMLEDFRKKQWDLEKARLNGEEIKPEQEEQFKKLAEIIQYNPYVRDFLVAEYNLNLMIMEIQRIIASAVGVKLPEEENMEKKDDGK